MTANDEVNKKNKKFAVGGGDLPPSPTTSTGTVATNTTTTNKRPTRHHVKRRSSGRVHVSKLAPMARAHIELDEDLSTTVVRKPMKRSQSNKSLTRLSSLEKKSTMTGFTPAVSATVDNKPEVVEIDIKNISPTSPPTTPPPAQPVTDTKQPTFHVTETIPATSIEQPLTVTADDLVIPEKIILL